MKIFSCLILLSTAIGIRAQSFSAHPIALTPTIFPRVTFKEEEYLEKIKTKLKDEKNKEFVDDYANLSLEGKKYYFNSNEIYTNWPQATEFVKKVFLKAVPTEFKIDNIKIYVSRSPDFNAYCMEDGNIVVTTGFLAFMNDEAELASTLAHEYGHYYCNHIFLSYKESRTSHAKSQKVRTIGSLFIMNNLSNYLKDSERNADTFSVRFARQNGYSANSIITDFENAQIITNKYKHLRGYRRPLFYFGSHPSNEERINKAKKEISKIGNQGKRFQIDSLEFSRIKRRAVDECIFLLFDELRFDECIELAFLQHLYYPTDEFYLYFLIEALNSQVSSIKYFDRAPFITCNYNLDKAKGKFEPVCFNEKDKVYEQNSEYKNSVFNHLRSFLFTINEQQYNNIKAKNLLNRDTIPFFTNAQALSYFNKKMKLNSLVFNIPKFQQNITINNDCSSSPEKSELENDLCEVYHSLSNMNSKYDSLENGLVILHKFQSYKLNNNQYHLDDDLETDKKVFNEFWDYGLKTPRKNIIHESKLNFRERSKIKYIANFINSLSSDNFLGISTDMDFLNLCPEFVHQSVKNKIETIFIVNFVLVEPYVLSGFAARYAGVISLPKSTANIFMIDLKNKRITKRAKDISSGEGDSYQKCYSDIYEECESLIKN